MAWSAVLDAILLINVCTVLVPRTLTLSASIPCELTHLPKLNIVHYRRRRHRLAGLGPVF